ncbi:putative invasin [Xenorhabdus poinarii G6]|uniref:Putative invasin n=1 Tax=Xenorhabdus poinarii G6 TaxID=1354304 RepID=A0A068R7Q3_9GAMM|nr:inverse autotransporter beta-barrel domain-containing protein [Xenorhabdus poinarii]CDG23049.1 putative invasin [Xenorhabdus poinarii G6]
MDSSISHKVIRLSVLIYSFCLPFTPMNAFSAAEKTSDNKTVSNVLSTSENAIQPGMTEGDQASLIAQNVQKVGHLLASSPAQLTEQAKSYALGKINNTFSSEAQKWLSQFGTAKIHFALDRKGKLDDGSLDLLLPLYDNKTDWLLFSQLGYRNKDSRHTLNFGLGGRYFTPEWMYGLNTFFDHDVTGQNKRLGLGGEAWTDYVKLSANTYWRLSRWHQSPKERDYEERPANGFDLNSEFFLPAYPNIGGKISYEQYFGDNVALFDRDTRQKDPNLARFGLNYTPVPLVTMGVDYKLGSGGHSETLFLANLNYRFGMPFGAQISPDNVATMRTLAGSRYDIVERNNNIVLDYRKKQTLTITLPSTLSGYNGQPIIVKAQIASNKSLKRVTWQTDQAFIDNKGSLLSNKDQAELVLPQYVNKGENRYTLSATAEDESGESKTTQMEIVVDPFVVKDQSVQPAGKGPVIADGKSAYQLAATITHGTASNAPIKSQVIPGVKWSLAPENPNAKLVWDEHGATNDQGQLTATLTSTEPLAADSKVFLEMDGMPKMAITGQGDTPLTFASIDTEYHIALQPVVPDGPLSINNPQDIYTFVATLLDKDNQPLQNKKIKATWTATPNDGVELKPGDSTNGITDDQGQLMATLKSNKAQAITVKLSIEDGPSQTFKPVSFINDVNDPVQINSFTFEKDGPYQATADNKVTVKALIFKDNKPLPPNTTVKVKWFAVTEPENLPGFILESANETQATTDQAGKIQATFSSTTAVQDAKIGLSVNGGEESLSAPFDFDPPKNLNAVLKGEIKPPYDKTLSGKLTGKDGKNRFKVLVVDATSGQPLPNQTVPDVTWNIEGDPEPNRLKMVMDDNPRTDAEGYLAAYLQKNANFGADNLVVTATLGSSNAKASSPVTIIPIEVPVGITIVAEKDKGQPGLNVEGKYSVFPEQQGQPLNVHNQLGIILTMDLNDQITGLPEGEYKDDAGKTLSIKLTHHTDVTATDENGYIVFPRNKFKPGPAKVTATVTRDGLRGIYTYTFHPERYLFASPKLDNLSEYGYKCENMVGKIGDVPSGAKTATNKDVGLYQEDQTGKTLVDEYPRAKFPDFHLSPGDPGVLFSYLDPTPNSEKVTPMGINLDTYERINENEVQLHLMLCKLGN